jgi:hypothetical protein
MIVSAPRPTPRSRQDCTAPVESSRGPEVSVLAGKAVPVLSGGRTCPFWAGASKLDSDLPCRIRSHVAWGSRPSISLSITLLRWPLLERSLSQLTPEGTPSTAAAAGSERWRCCCSKCNDWEMHRATPFLPSRSLDRLKPGYSGPTLSSLLLCAKVPLPPTQEARTCPATASHMVHWSVSSPEVAPQQCGQPRS